MKKRGGTVTEERSSGDQTSLRRSSKGYSLIINKKSQKDTHLIQMIIKSSEEWYCKSK
jgi:hypothetical protein